MLSAVVRLRAGFAGWFRKFPWIGWALWSVFVVAALLRTHPRRFGSTFTAYLEAAQHLWAQQQVYDPTTLGDFLYLPVALLILAPLSHLQPIVAAAITLAVYAALFSWAAYALMRALLPQGGRSFTAWQIAGLILLVNIPAAWFNFKGVQSQIVMTAAMMAGCAMMIRAQWLAASCWLVLALVMKPLALVMALLSAALCPRTRLPLIFGFLLALALPFAFFDTSYLLEQYRAYGLKLWLIATAPPAEWPYQADFTTLLRALHIVLPGVVSLALRLVSSLATLALAWQARKSGPRAFALALFMLAACYINLFGPRNEYLSFLVLTPSLGALSLLLLDRDDADMRGWILLVAALVLGMDWAMPVNTSLKPAIVVALYVWLARQFAVPGRWRRLVEGDAAAADHPEALPVREDSARGRGAPA